MPLQLHNTFAREKQVFVPIDPNDVRMALDAGCAAATILPRGGVPADEEAQQLRVAFDGDAPGVKLKLLEQLAQCCPVINPL